MHAYERGLTFRLHVKFNIFTRHPSGDVTWAVNYSCLKFRHMWIGGINLGIIMRLVEISKGGSVLQKKEEDQGLCPWGGAGNLITRILNQSLESIIRPYFLPPLSIPRVCFHSVSIPFSLGLLWYAPNKSACLRLTLPSSDVSLTLSNMSAVFWNLSGLLLDPRRKS